MKNFPDQEQEVKYAKYVVIPSPNTGLRYSFRITDLDTAKSLEDVNHPILYWNDDKDECYRWALLHRWVVSCKNFYESRRNHGSYVTYRSPLTTVKVKPAINDWAFWLTIDKATLLLYASSSAQCGISPESLIHGEVLEDDTLQEKIEIISAKDKKVIDEILERLNKLEKEVEELKHDGEDFRKYTFSKWSETCDEKLTFEEAIGFRDFAQANGWLAVDELRTKKEWTDRLRDYIHRIK